MPGARAVPLYLRAALPRPGARPTTARDVVLSRTGVRPRPDDVAAYCAVVGQPRGECLPLLYPHLFGFDLQLRLMGDAAFPFPALGLVQVSNQVTAEQSLAVTGSYDVQVRAGSVRPHPRGRVVDLVTTVSRHGRPVWYATSTYLRRERAAATAGNGASRADGPPDADASVPDHVGPLHHSARWRLEGDLGRRYARVSGDVNPIHLSPWTARPLGFPRAIAHGMWTAAAVAGALHGRLPDAVRYTVRFRRPILLPGTVRLLTAVSGEAADAEVRGRDGDDRVHLYAAFRTP
ncbi:MAG TPA: MaoC/PaaZ C-terminal domain-containing protein [Kineosporiaceae bacterium]